MLWNTFHKFLIYHHIQFQVLVLTTTPNLKINATATFQIICNLQKRTRAIMDSKNVSKRDQKIEKVQRSSRSYSSPSRRHNISVVRPQRAQSELVFSGSVELGWWQSYAPCDFVGNSILQEVPNVLSCCQPLRNSNIQIGWNPTSNLFCPNPHVRPLPSASDGNYRCVRSEILPTNQGTTSRRWSKKGLDRKWEPIKTVNNKEKKFHFTLMSYNVLAQDLIDNHEYLYRDHDVAALQWKVRWVNILKEIGDADPDIICFQEVQESHIGGYFSILEKKLGYKSIYKKRTGIRTDGCAIYYKKKRLQLIEHEKVEYFQEDVAILNRDNVALVARFIPKEVHTQAFIVATTHLLYNPKREDVRLAQVQSLIAEIDKMAFLGTNDDGSATYLPIILTGDLNATPESAVYEFITRGVLDYENLSVRSLSKENGKETTGKVLVPRYLQMTDNCQFSHLVKQRNEIIKTCTKDGGENIETTCVQDLKFSSGTLSHPFSFKSAYRHVINQDIEGTTHQDQWITVDYIFYSAKKKKGSMLDDRLKLLSKYQLFTKKQLNGVRIPNWKLGSDHFSLIVKFSLE